MSDDKSIPHQTVRGRLTLRTFARNTKSESLGVYLETDDDCFLIRPASGNAFENPIARLAGKWIEATGRRSAYVFFATEWHEINDPG
ncbi:hypothetical protein [Chitinophaga sp.]|uniref:hypothetical protein n=1 Tax=Chitinophaga sp. TaxID=1869181 RepID=UPI0026109A67|nr:hypothetical protein [uncultured Chitinophaga sp.]